MSEDDSDGVDLDDLARQYLELWQEHLGALAKDDNTTRIMEKTLELMNTGAMAFQTMAAASAETAKTDGDASNEDYSATKADIATAARAASSDAASGDRDMDSAVLLARIRELENRLEKLEAQPRTGQKKSTPAKKTGKRRS